ncbi:uncharacterized protein F4822DRAFT_184607 [Hypoxylon trugodes]|uniref:uncharacterized protein n=1 Tax=Hypoxylon trugodes TaxID=326681 RepID=UPI00219F0715|nr:uncharacterized protein F4822DRAFT_184607 [Hypoxylon trugodes]KAI1391394.1 hypothetical protein F4822DRAFT_184607 [Hypoxylon trugodes]
MSSELEDHGVIPRPAEAPPITLSTGAIAGIAVGGAVVLFAALAPLLIKLAKRQERRRRASISVAEAFGETPEETAGPKRLRKKSFIGEPVTVDKEDDEVGREEGESRRSSLHVAPSISPSKSRQGSFSAANDGSGRGSVDTVNTQSLEQLQKQRSPEKQRGYGMYQHRRKTSWIDEDALHGPTTSPRKSKQKHKRRVSWFDGGLGRSLSRLSTRSGMGEVSPTLPYTGTDDGAQFETPTEGDDERESREVAQGKRFSYATTPPRSVRQQHHQQQQQAYTSPQRSYGPSNNPSPGSSSNDLSKSPPDIVHNPRYRQRVSFQAAQQLAGGARLPAPIGIPQGQRQPILKHSATETELAEILRMTAERLQDGNRSSRRQTLMSPFSSVRFPMRRGQSYHNGGYPDINYEPSDRGDVSPVKNHKSAPATMSYAKLEGCTPRNQSPQRQMQTPRHSRHISHMSQISQVSMISEVDSLVAPKRESLQEIHTALSSPSRAGRSAEPTPSPEGMRQSQQMRPFSNGSTLSSALSTLYSMEEASIRSPPANDLRIDTNVNRFSGQRQIGETSPKHKYEEVPSPLRIRRGTLGGIVAPDTTPASRPGSRQNRESAVLPSSRTSFMIHAMNDTEDPFTAVTTPQNPARLSKVFSPIPTQMPKESGPKPPSGARPIPEDSQYVETPTPSPTRRGVLPSPRTILNSPSNRRAPSPVISEAGLSSVYDSYIYTYNETSGGSSANSSTDTTTKSDVTLSRRSSSVSTGRESRVGFRIPNYGQSNEDTMATPTLACSPMLIGPRSPPQPRRSVPSDGSIYSQDTVTTITPATNTSNEDRVPPLRASTVKKNKSVRMSSTITELRRMNSQISTMSDVSVASSTLPGMRGGGSSPGRQSNGGKNYLSLGGGLRNSGMFMQLSNGIGGGSLSDVGVVTKSPIRRGSVNRSRRGTVVLQGLDSRMSANIGTNSVKRSSQLMSHAARLSREESKGKRVSVESLYDSKGFLKN